MKNAYPDERTDDLVVMEENSLLTNRHVEIPHIDLLYSSRLTTMFR